MSTSATQPTKKSPVRIVFEDGQPVALIRARTEAQAVRHVTRKKYEAPIADQDHLLKHGSTLPFEDANSEDA